MNAHQLPINKNFDYKINDKKTHLFVLTNRAGMQIALTDYGARLVSALVPDKKGNLTDVVLGFDSIEGYQTAKEQYHGATIGRYANRIANGKCNINNQDYHFAINNGQNSLHGGKESFHTQVWDRQVSFNKKVDFYYISPDGEEGYPGELKVTTSYELTNENEIVITFRATTDKTTIVNLTNHAYFNLNGEGNGNVLNHLVKINSSHYAPINAHQIPIGELSLVENTAFDFRIAKKIGQDIHENTEQLKFANGYDHSFANTLSSKEVIAEAYSEESGIQLQVKTDLPALHLYSGNFLSDDKGKSGKRYEKHGGFCFEAQFYPDGPNQPDLASIELHPNEIFEKRIVYKFCIKK